MRKSLLGLAVALALTPALAAHAQNATTGAATADGTKVTGVVKEVDKNGGRLVVNDETYMLPPSGGTFVVPDKGDEITFFYEDRGGQKVVTRIGQKQQ